MSKLDEYYNKFNEDKRLSRRHGIVEFIISMKYIHECLEDLATKFGGKDNTGVTERSTNSQIKIIDIGAGTGRYSVPLSEEGYCVTAVELVNTNLGKLKAKQSQVKAYQGNATNLKKFPDEAYDLTILFGPMYHLIKHEDKLKALTEAKRVTKKDGYILVAYCMNDYSILTYGFKEKHVLECMESGRFSEDFKCTPGEDELYDYVRLDEIDVLNLEAGLNRVKILSPDGPANYMRQTLNALSEEEFKMFINYQLCNCQRPELLGAGGHVVDILKK